MPLSMLAILALGFLGSDSTPARGLIVEPSEVRLRGSDASVQLLATARFESGQLRDVTRTANFKSDDPSVAIVGADGLIRPRGEGRTTVQVRSGPHESTVVVVVDDYADSRPVCFSTEVIPIFSKHGCNSGGCHGKAVGQNGFKLSLLGFDPRFDYESLVREGRGRRVFPAAPATSLLLTKSTARVPHGGGRKFVAGSPEFNTIARWIAQGTPFDTGKEPRLTGLAVSPTLRTLGHKDRQQLRVVASYDDGSTSDVTRLSQFSSNSADLASVDGDGLVTTLDGVGEAAIMVRFGGQVTVARATLPLGRDDVPVWEIPKSSNLIDPLVFSKLKELGLMPSEPCTDAEFARRSALDLCGLLPSPEEVARYETDTAPDKKIKWIDRLLERPEYADYFAMKWSAILRNQRGIFGGTGQTSSFAFHAWVREAIAENRPYDRFASDLIAAKGDPTQNPAVSWYRNRDFMGDEAKQLKEQVDDTAQLFLGMRIGCAQCHHHPFEKWSQDDYYGFASFFTRVGKKPGSDLTSPRVFVKASGLARHPSTGKSYPPKALDGPEFAKLGPRDDPRASLASWLSRPDNPFFARALVNRYWKHFFGRGVVEPEDDMRVSNPPTNPELLDALAEDFVTNGYDLKRLVRLIASSRAYGLSSLPNEFNGADRQNYARFYPRRLPAEVLLDSVGTVTQSPDGFAGMPKGFRAIQLPDDSFGSYFLDIFGRPKRESVCECERVSEANLSQRLHLLNSGEIESKLSNGSGRAAGYASDKDTRTDAEKIDELYRLTLARKPSQEDLSVCLAHLSRHRQSKTLRQGYEDLIWTLLNAKEFLFNR